MIQRTSSAEIICKTLLVILIIISILITFYLPYYLYKQSDNPDLLWVYIVTVWWMYEGSDLSMRIIRTKF